jgi:dihydroorotase-like cyclic amidohydrolase
MHIHLREPGFEHKETIIDPDRSYTVEAAKLRSLSSNTPFDGWQLKGGPILAMVGGRILFESKKFSHKVTRTLK